MSKKKLYAIIAICLTINILLITTVLYPAYSNYKENESKHELKKETIIKEDTEEEETKEIIEILPEENKPVNIKVELKDNLNVSFLKKVKVSDFIKSINGEIIDDYEIKTNKLGEQEVSFEYINEDNVKVPYSYKIKVEDKTAPVIWLNDTYTVKTTYNGSLLEDIVCADDIDDNPKCEIIGSYNTKKAGEYKLTFKATDASGNTTTKKFTLKVKEPETKKPSNDNSKPTYTYFKDVVKEHKTSKTKIGLDVSSWQGDIDFDKVAAAGVEFVYIRVGSTYGIDGDYFLDKKFKRNIEGFNRVGIPVGIYFYTYANSRDKAIQDAKWVLKQIDGYKIDLPIAYDWESWSIYNKFKQSFYSTSENARAFLDLMEEAGYKGILYSSKSYLEKVWFDIGYDVWLAHYTKQTSYKGPYTYWQLCSNGKIDGINGTIDINIMYT